MILGVDPGQRYTGMVWLDGDRVSRSETFEGDHHLVLRAVRLHTGPVGIERIEARQQPFGKDVRDTCELVGRFIEASEGRPWEARPQTFPVTRGEVAMHFLGRRAKAGDPQIRGALIDLWGGKAAAIGGKPKRKSDPTRPGPLHGIKGHEWAALAVAVYVRDVLLAEQREEVG